MTRNPQKERRGSDAKTFFTFSPKRNKYFFPLKQKQGPKYYLAAKKEGFKPEKRKNSCSLLMGTAKTQKH